MGPICPKRTFPVWIRTVALLSASMVITCCIKHLHMGANRHNSILMSLLLLFAEIIKFIRYMMLEATAIQKEIVRKQGNFSHWCHVPAFTIAQSNEQDPNVNNVSKWRDICILIRPFYLNQVVQDAWCKLCNCRLQLFWKNKRNSYFRVTTKNYEWINIFWKNIIIVVTWNRVVDKSLKDRINKKNIYVCEQHFPEKQLLRYKHSFHVQILLEWFLDK